MEERRKSKRTVLESKLLMKRLDGVGSNEEVDIEVSDVSKSGIGFTAARKLEIGQTYEAFLTIWTKEVIHSLIQVVRIELKEDYYIYGAIFVGMSPTEANRIEVYQIFNDSV